MAQHTKFLEGVKEVLENEEIMKQAAAYGDEKIQEIIEERTAKWRMENIIAEGEYNKRRSVKVPSYMMDQLDDENLENGFISIDTLKAKVLNYQPREDEMAALMKERVENLLEKVDREKIDHSSSLMAQYEKALSVNKKGYSIHYKRDVDEVMVNTYNPEWISAWNGNMDFQLCLDYFAVITYISDYYCKDDSGTMKIL